MSRAAAVLLSALMVLSVVAATSAVAAPGASVAAGTASGPGDPDPATNETGTAATGAAGSTAAASRSPPTSVLTGFHHPTVDGILYGETGQDLPDGKASEWADGVDRPVEFAGPDGEVVDGRLYAKSVSDSLYVGARMVDRNGPLRSVTVGIDRDGSGDLSSGDVRIVAEPSGSGSASAPGSVIQFTVPERGVRVYRDGEFVPVESVADVDGEALRREVGTFAVPDGQPFVAPEEVERAATIEARINESALDERLGDAADDSGSVSVSFETDSGTYEIGDSVDTGYDIGGQRLDRRDIETPELGITFPRVDLGTDLEVAQALQTEGSDLPLVADKGTLARAFVTHNKSSSVKVRVTFTAYRPEPLGVTLGSRTVTFDAPPGTPDRMDLDDSANLELPAAWTDQPVRLKATVDPVFAVEAPDTGDSVDSGYFGFVDTYDPSVYRLRVNTGTASNPQRTSTNQRDLVSQTFVDTYPVDDARFTDVNPDLIGAYGPNANNNRGQLRSDLDSLSDSFQMMRQMGVQFGSGSALPPFPDQVYGIAQVRGLSDPPWGSGPGEAFAGFGSLFRVTMAHEINHNVGDTPWAFHVNVTGTRCNAPRRDSTWNSMFTDNDINRIGWNPGSGLVAPGTADIMTYCTPRWMSDYRWTRMHQRMQTFQAGQPVHPNLGTGTALDVPASEKEILGREVPTGRVITGQLFPNGTGTLDPTFERPGIVENPETGRELEDPDAILVIERTDGTTDRTQLDAEFEDVEGQELTSSGFSIAVNDGSTIERIALVDAETEEILDARERTGFTLQEATIDTPEAFERGERVDVGTEVVTDAEGTLYKRLLYSPDPETGLWYPYRPTTTDDGFRARFTQYPGGEEARFLLVVSDGVGTEFAVSEPFTVEPKAPEVSIQRNERLEAVGQREGTRDEPPAFEIRDAAGPVETTAGGVVSLDASATDQYGASLADRETTDGTPTIRWHLAGSDETLATGPRFTRTFATPGTYELRVTATDPTSGRTAHDTITVEVDEPPLPDSETVRAFREAVENATSGDGGATVALRPTVSELSPDRTTTVDVVVTDVDGGVGSYELVVTATDTAIARIAEGESRVGGTGRVERTADGSGVRIGAFAGDTNDTGTVTIATVTVAGVEPGTAGLSVTVESIADEAGSPYELAGRDVATVRVREEPRAPEVVAGSPAGDLDGDGVYEDVNGDNDVTPGDATVLFNAVFEGNAAVRNNPEKFDANGDGEVTPGDASVLFDRAFAA